MNYMCPSIMGVRDTCHCHNVWFLHILKHLLVCNKGIGAMKQWDCMWCGASIRRTAGIGDGRPDIHISKIKYAVAFL